MKKTIKHAIAIALIVSFAALALGSMGSSPSSSGDSSFTSSGICKTCNGKGYVETSSQTDENGWPIYIKKTCSTCFGKGRV